MQSFFLHKRTFVISLCLLFLAFTFLVGGFGYYLLTPAKKGCSDRIFFVSEGSALSNVANALEKEGFITCKSAFLIWGRLMGYAIKIKAGEYLLNPAMSPLKILETLSRGIVVTHSVTIPEGYTRAQIVELLEREGLVDRHEFMKLTGDPNIALHYGISGPDLEGYLYPDTYQFSRGLSEMSIIDVMVKRFQEVIKPFRGRIEESGMTMNQVVILASIVEKETGSAEERPVIASVFLNRLKKGKRLESDPTVIYGIKDFDGNLRKKDLAERTPYNTYVINGLPPGAIANPGREAIKAILYPAETDYLYFVSKNDGSHHFSKTLSEHNRAVIIYQMNGRAMHIRK